MIPSWKRESLITHILFELQPIIIFSPVANFGDQSLYQFSSSLVLLSNLDLCGFCFHFFCVPTLTEEIEECLQSFGLIMLCFVLFHSRESDGFMRPDRSWHLFQGRTGVDKEEKLHFFYLLNFFKWYNISIVKIHAFILIIMVKLNYCS